MEEIAFSVFNHGQAASEAIQVLLKQFETRYGIKVRLETIPTWKLGWSRLVENALYRSGPDISEAGDIWIGDLARMDALYPFTQEEVNEITKDARLFKNVWRSRIRDEHGKSMIYSIPWSGDTRAVFYRRDMLEKAGVDETTAFIDTAHFKKTICTLSEMGISMPLALTSRHSSLTIHYIASWIWGAGGDFLSSDGINLAFTMPRAMDGCKAYFRLGRYLGEDARNLDEEKSDITFRSGKASVTFLVLWNHSRHKPSAIKLIEFLHGDE